MINCPHCHESVEHFSHVTRCSNCNEFLEIETGKTVNNDGLAENSIWERLISGFGYLCVGFALAAIFIAVYFKSMTPFKEPLVSIGIIIIIVFLLKKGLDIGFKPLNNKLDKYIEEKRKELEKNQD